ncbi:uncharacterized protein LOC106167129 [Lingula anatina]|uniref:Uncharacterized protein LOC106167129 n=1 Tax=Lingula anatina TaxID=7574 RepID=A0A1S3ITN1_LINAN|nr:uncharacterized protein LOC106167129 [Lingula anatina]|eukprot:XP_013401291.1 uncharacterized protein LOC106167129 [Lingula anatina]
MKSNMTLTETKMDLYNIRRSYTTLDQPTGSGFSAQAQVSRPLTRGSHRHHDHYSNNHHGNGHQRQVDNQTAHLTESLMIRPLTVSNMSVDQLPSRTSHSAGLAVERSQTNMYIPGKGRPERQPEKMAVMPNREEAPVSKATVPKKGLIKLTALQFEQDDPNYFDRSKEQREKNKWKTKPLPMNHKKLIDKQRKLGTGGHDRWQSAEPADTWADLVPEEYTVGDLQKKILQFADFAGADRNPYLRLNARQPANQQQGPHIVPQGAPAMSYDMDVESVTSEVTMATTDMAAIPSKKVAVVPRNVLPTLPPSEKRRKPDSRYPALRS